MYPLLDSCGEIANPIKVDTLLNKEAFVSQKTYDGEPALVIDGYRLPASLFAREPQWQNGPVRGI